MKRFMYMFIFIAILLFAFLIYKNNKNETIDTNTNNNYVKPKENKEDKAIEEPEYIDDNPIKLGLYKNYRNGSKRKLITEYSAPWKYHTDISSFEVYYTQEDEISSGNQIKTFDLYKDNYENVVNYKIGYILNFKINDKEINKTIVRPKDTEEFYDYLEIYLYDDYHRTGGWYSHTTDEEFNEKTLLTSIKLTAGKNIKEITSDILVTAFTYDKDDFDEQGNYIGISKYQIVVKNTGN